MAPLIPKELSGELGAPGLASSSGFLETWEETPELQWPNSVRIYDLMRKTDAQIGSVHRAIRLPILGTHWHLKGDDVRPEVMALCERDLGLDRQNAKLGRRRNRGQRVNWREFLSHVLLGPIFGHIPFEKVYEVGPPPDDVAEGLPEYVAHLAKLGPRMPRSIWGIAVDANGNLQGIRQWVPAPDPGSRPGMRYGWDYGYVHKLVDIPADRLAYFCHEREGSDWLGSALPLDTPIATPDGWSTMGQMRVGSRLFDEAGKVRHVVARSQVWSDRPCYRVRFSDGASLIADENHLWESHTYKARHHGHAPQILTTAQMASTLHYGSTARRRLSNHAVVKPAPLEYARADLLVDPYVLGAWLGDGTTLSATITQADTDAVDLARLVEERGFATKTVHNGPAGGRGRLIRVYGLQSYLRALGVLGDKHVPEGYLRSSADQRLALLRGLMDTDGSTTNGSCEFSNTNRDLVDGVLDLVRSLGCHASVYRVTRDRTNDLLPGGRPARVLQPVWRVHFSPTFTPFALPRKVAAFESGDHRQRGATKGRETGPRKWRTIVSIEPVEPRDTVCIEVDSPSHLFLAGRELIPTHNSILREAYKHWMLKDVLIKVDAMSIERNGMGVPDVSYPEGGDEKKALQIARSYRASDKAGIAHPHDYEVKLLAVQGSLRDALPSIKYHDESAGRAALAMFLNLGHDRGARSLGDTFVDFFTMALNSEIEMIEEFVTEDVIRDLVALNFGEDEPYPELEGEDLTAESMPTAEGLAALGKAGLLTRDNPLENDLRRRFGFPLLSIDPNEIATDPLGDEGAATDTEPDDAQDVSIPIPGGGQGPTLASAGKRMTLAEAEKRLAAVQRRIAERKQSTPA